MSTTEESTLTTTQVYRIYIRATPEAIWDAITNPDWNEKYGYPGRGEFDLRPGGKYLATADEQAQAMGMPAELVDGEVLEVDPPRKLVHTWHGVGAPGAPSTVTYRLERLDGGTRVTLRHSGLVAREVCTNTCIGWETSFERLVEILATELPSAGA